MQIKTQWIVFVETDYQILIETMSGKYFLTTPIGLRIVAQEEAEDLKP